MKKFTQLSPQSPRRLAWYIKHLPEWGPVDDDPNWLRPVSDYGFRAVAGHLSPLEHEEITEIRAEIAAYPNLDVLKMVVDPRRIKYANQENLRLDVLNHYTQGETELWDRDGWFGNSLPVVTGWRDALIVIDGCHRIAADRIAGRMSTVVLFPNSLYPTSF